MFIFMKTSFFKGSYLMVAVAWDLKSVHWVFATFAAIIITYIVSLILWNISTTMLNTKHTSTTMRPTFSLQYLWILWTDCCEMWCCSFSFILSWRTQEIFIMHAKRLVTCITEQLWLCEEIHFKTTSVTTSTMCRGRKCVVCGAHSACWIPHSGKVGWENVMW